MTHLAFPSTLPNALRGAETVLVLVPEKPLKAGWLGEALAQPWAVVLEKAAAKEEAGPQGKTLVLVNPEKGPERIVLGILPDTVSRHNCPARADAVHAAAAAAGLSGKTAAVIACLDEEAHALPVARAVARALPLFSRTSKKPGSDEKDEAQRRKPKVAFFAMDREGCAVALAKPDREIVERSRWAAELVDTPTAEMTTADFEKAVRKAARGLEHVRVKSIVGPALLEKKLGGIHAVGRTATVAPRLVLIEYRPPKAKRHVGLVGKGVVYDTGGLSLKSSAGMSGMKCDMGGAAAAAGAGAGAGGRQGQDGGDLRTPPRRERHRPEGVPPRRHPDDALRQDRRDQQHRRRGPPAARRRRVVRRATLQGRCRRRRRHPDGRGGHRHGHPPCRRRVATATVWSSWPCEVGQATGDLVAPLPFAPEFFQKEFESKVADMKNSVANRMNAQSSCAAQFVYSHIEDLDLPWLHVDLAGPAFRQDRAHRLRRGPAGGHRPGLHAGGRARLAASR